MTKLGLSGNRYSGKDKIADAFDKIGVPVFDADTVLKFILKYNYDLISDIRKYVGNEVFLGDSINLRKLNKETFDKILDIVEDDLFNAYNKFQKRYDTSIYTIFNSSILFEREWDSKMDLSISVFSSKTDRIKRCKTSTGSGLLLINELIGTEMDPTDKNEMADYVIHNYDDGGINVITGNVLKQVSEIDQKIIDEYIYKEQLGIVY